MKDVTVKLVRSKIASAVISVNGKEFEVNSSFAVLSKVYKTLLKSTSGKRKIRG